MNPVVENSTSAYKAPMTASAWELYDLPGAEQAAQAIGAKLTELVAKELATGNCGLQAGRAVRDGMYLLMSQYENLGARDSAVEYILVGHIERALKLEDSLSR